MPELLVERGIGETRRLLVENDRIIEARIDREGIVPAGTVLAARLARAGRNGIAVADGQDYLLPNGASGVTEGAAFTIEVCREALVGTEHWKRPLARKSDEAPRPPIVEGDEVPFPTLHDRVEEAGWSDLLDEARSGIVRFAGGELRISLTPAMTLIDVDGTLPPAELAVAGARVAAISIRRHGIGGSIGIDLPTVSGKADRQAAAAEIDRHLPQPFERTAVNGFGFVQIVRPRRHASLFELAQDRSAFEARALLRRAARETGAIVLAANPAVITVLEAQPAWLTTLSRQVGGTIGLRPDAALPMSGGYASRA